MITNYINHIVFTVDQSGSLSHLKDQVIKIFDNQIQYLAKRSQELDQETRVSVYLFNDNTECLVYDKDVLRLPSLKSYYQPRGNTALIDAMVKSLDELGQTSQLYGEAAYLVYCLTDGIENASRTKPEILMSKIKNLPDNWTVACLVPDQTGVFEAKRFGFPADNIQVWSVSSKGVEDVGRVMREATDNFMRSRSSGIRGTKRLFTLNTNISTTEVKNELDILPPFEYDIFNVYSNVDIKSYVESWTKKPYIKGSSYYQLTKPENIQNYKFICIQDKRNGKIYSGKNARKLLGLPNFDVKVNPADFADFNVFVQSTSLNRKLIKGTDVIVMK